MQSIEDRLPLVIYSLAMMYLGTWILDSKLITGDLVYLPGYIIFRYFDSFIKLYTL